MDEVEVDHRLAAYAVIRDDGGRVLLTLWNQPDPPLWSVPGGGVEVVETFEQGAVREVREETGFDVELVRLLGVDTRLFLAHERLGPVRDRHSKHVRVVYEARVTGGVLTHEVGGSSSEARWFGLDEVDSLPRVGLVDVALSMAGLTG